MSTPSVPVRPRYDTHDEGVQTCLDVLFDRQSTLFHEHHALLEAGDLQRAAMLSPLVHELQNLIHSVRAATRTGGEA